MPIRPYQGQLPRLGQRVYVDPGAHLMGDVELGDDVSLWPGVVVRGDVNYIRIVTRPGGYPTIIGADVTIGHGAIVHACVIEDACLIGMHATVLDGATVRKNGFVGAGAVIAPGKTVGERELWLGNPAKLVRVLSDRDVESLYYSATHYVKLKDRYLDSGE